MSFLKELVLQNGATAGFHKITSIATLENCTRLQAKVSSWPTYQSYAERKDPIWAEYFEIPMYDLYTKTQDVIHTMEPFVDATIIEDLEGLSQDKIKKWWEIKVKRDQVEFGGFVWDGSVFDSDSQSQSRIQGAVQLAVLASQASQPFSITWTLQDNSARALNSQEMIAVGMALAEHIQDTHETARLLRAQIDSSNTAEEVAAVTWPTT